MAIPSRFVLQLFAGFIVLLVATGPALTAPLLPAAQDIQRWLEADDVDRAIAAAERGVAALPEDARTWLWAGRAYGRQALEASIFGKAKWAGRTREAWERAVALDPNYLDAHLDLLGYYLAAPALLGGGEDKARAQAGAIAALDASMGKYAEATLQMSDDRPGAEALLREAVALDPDNRRATLLLAGLAVDRKDWAAARAAWQPALEGDGALVHVARYQLGRLAAMSGEALEQGLAHLDAYIAADPDDDQLGIPAAQWRRGQILEKLGHRDQAIAAWRLAMDDKDVGKLARADLKRLGAG